MKKQVDAERMAFRNAVAASLEQVIAIKNVTWNGLATATGFDKMTLHRIRYCQGDLSLQEAKKLAEYAGIPIDRLYQSLKDGTDASVKQEEKRVDHHRRKRNGGSSGSKGRQSKAGNRRAKNRNGT